MSLYGALYAGVAGLQAQSNKLGIISDNVANVNTVGYKAASAVFETLVTNASNATAYSPGGVLGANQQLVSQQGLLTTTSSPTDIAVSGSGFFVVNQKADQSGQVLYTRAGSFTQDSAGNFLNSSGYFLQAWPLDSDGNLPGAPGNADTTSSANLSSLQTVNVENVTGAASATTNVSIAANLTSSQGVFPGAAGTTSTDATDTVNSSNNAAALLVPDTANGLLTNGTDGITVTTAISATTYTYGGITYSRAVNAPGHSLDGDSGTDLPSLIHLTSSTVADFTSGSNLVTIHATNSLQTGDVVKLSNTTGADGLGVDGLNGLDGDYYVMTAGAGQFTIALPSSVASPAPAAVPTSATFAVTGTHTVTLSYSGSLPAGIHAGDTLNFVNAPTLGSTGILGSDLDTCTVASVDYGTNVITITTAGTSTSTGGSTAAASDTTMFENRAIFGTSTNATTATVNPRIFSGNILDATSATSNFLSTPADFSDAAKTFTINTPTTGTVTFTYTQTAPNVQQQQFNSLSTLADAINSVTGLTARVVTVDGNTRLYAGPADATESMTVTNGATLGVNNSAGAIAGIDWVGELGLNDTIGAQANRFNSLQSLADAVNGTTGLTATVSNPTSTATVAINVDDPTGTIAFANTTGDLLTELGLPSGVLQPSYNAAVPANNMTSGAVSAQFSRPVTIFDSLGTAHNVNIAFLKTGTANMWSVEIYAQPAGDINATGSHPAGQIAAGNISFNGDGTLKSIDSTLSDAQTINWTNDSNPSTVTFQWGTLNSTTGLSQFDSAYNVTSVNQNGEPVGELTGVAIDSNGFITASFSNGQTKNLYKIPLGIFTDPNQLQSVSGNAYAQTSASGEVNLRQAGSSGTGTLSSGALEASNVELANQLTDMIVAQRAYQANTKVISTADTLLNDLDQILQ